MIILKRILGLSVLLSAVVCIPHLAHADSGPDLRLFELSQDGQDVLIKYGYNNNGYDSSFKMSLVREQGDSSLELFDGLAPPEEEATMEYTDCDVWNCESLEEDFCENNPDKCVDCDSDDIPECCGDCVWDYSWTFIDTCVVPGETVYVIYESGEPDESPDSESITVTDTGDECLEKDAGADSGAGSDSDADTDTDTDTDDDTDDDAESEDDSDSGNCRMSPYSMKGSTFPDSVFLAISIIF